VVKWWLTQGQEMDEKHSSSNGHKGQPGVFVDDGSLWLKTFLNLHYKNYKKVLPLGGRASSITRVGTRQTKSR